MGKRSPLRTRILLCNPRSYLITNEGSSCPVKLTDTQRDDIASNWHKVQEFCRIGVAKGTLYARPA